MNFAAPVEPEMAFAVVICYRRDEKLLIPPVPLDGSTVAMGRIPAVLRKSGNNISVVDILARGALALGFDMLNVR